MAIKAGSVAVLALGIWLSFSNVGVQIGSSVVPNNAVPVSILIVSAILACAMGDALLSWSYWPLFFLGIICFAIGHAGYIAVMATSFEMLSEPPSWVRFGVVTLAGISIFILPQSIPLVVRVGMMAYACVLFSMVWFAISSGIFLLGLGGSLFILSDLLIAIEMDERVPEPVRVHLPRAIWATYWPAQACLVWGFSSVL